jgi:Protein of unknown function (DUF4038)/Putative collagen-binding domain of a collagenase
MTTPEIKTARTMTGWEIAMVVTVGLGAAAGCAIEPEELVSVESALTATPSFVQQASTIPQSPQTTVSVAYGQAQRAGDLDVVIVGWNDTSAQVSAVTDVSGNSYQVAAGATTRTTALSQAMYFASNIRAAVAGRNLVTVSFTRSAQFVDLRVLEYAGIDPVNPLDRAVGASGSGSNTDSGALLTSVAGDLLVAGNTVTTRTASAGSGFLSRVITNPDGDLAEDRLAGAAGSYNATAPIAPAGNWVMQLVAFRAATVSGNGAGGSASSGVGGSGSGGSGTGGAVVAGVGGSGSGGAHGIGGANGVGGSGIGGATGTGGSGIGGAIAAGSPFPVAYAANRRYLQDRNGVPFPILGRTAWFVLSRVAADYQAFVDDSVARGYDAIELHVINHDSRGNNAPFAGNGQAPFLRRLDGASWGGSLSYSSSAAMPDFTTPNASYWSFVDAFLAYCDAHGVLVLLFPAYVGYGGGGQGWMQEMLGNGASRMQTYGAFIANRYRDQRNLVWMMGGDMGTGFNAFDQPETSVENGLLTGMKSVAGQQSIHFSAEWDSESIATDQTSFGTSMTLNGAYSWIGDVPTQGRRAYGRASVEPSFLLEEPYDEEGDDGNAVNSNATQPVRRFQWWGWLSTIGGYVSGNGYVWTFNGTTWRNHLDTQGSRDMARLNAFTRAMPWYQLVPSGMGGVKTLITAGAGSTSDASYVAAAATPDGAWLVAYVPPAHRGSVTIDRTALGGTARARWYNPTTGAYTAIGSVPNTGTQAFSPPGNNGSGYSDWVLVLDKQ